GGWGRRAVGGRGGGVGGGRPAGWGAGGGGPGGAGWGGRRRGERDWRGLRGGGPAEGRRAEGASRVSPQLGRSARDSPLSPEDVRTNGRRGVPGWLGRHTPRPGRCRSPNSRAQPKAS